LRLIFVQEIFPVWKLHGNSLGKFWENISQTFLADSSTKTPYHTVKTVFMFFFKLGVGGLHHLIK